jgi:MFS family permease
MAPLPSNPFAVLSFIVAPAILTNSSTVLILSTSNRLARAVDRARALSKELDASQDPPSEADAQRLRELTVVEKRSVLLVRALRIFYLAVSGFASAALLSLAGAILAESAPAWVATVLGYLVIVAGLVAVGSIIHGAVLLVRETRMAVDTLSEQTASLRFRVTHRGPQS